MFLMVFLGHPGLDINVGEFLDNIQLNNLKDIFEKEEVRNVQLIEGYKSLSLSIVSFLTACNTFLFPDLLGCVG